MAGILLSKINPDQSPYEIGDFRALHVDGDFFIDSNSNEWLRTGIVDDDLIKYQEAKKTIVEVAKSLGTTKTAAHRYIAWDGTNFWSINYDTRLVTQYDDKWVETGVSFTASQASQYVHDIFFDGTHLNVLRYDQNTVYKLDGTYVSQYSTTAFGAAVSSGCVEGEHVYLVDHNGQVSKITKEGVTTGNTYNVGGTVTAIEGITALNGKFYVASRNSGFVYEFDQNFVHTGIILSFGQSASCLFHKDDTFYTCNNSGVIASTRRFNAVGNPEKLEDAGKPVFVRIK